MARKSSTPNKIRVLLSALIAILIIALVAWVLRDRAPKSGVIPSSSPQPPSGSASPDQSTNPNSPRVAPSQYSPKSTTTGPGVQTSTTDLVAPYGSFVSNHHPVSSDQEISACSTSPGAICYIQFTSGSITKKLEPQQAASDGSTSWLWKVSDAGLTQGSWRISAVASLSGQARTTNDQISLEVQ